MVEVAIVADQLGKGVDMSILRWPDVSLTLLSPGLQPRGQIWSSGSNRKTVVCFLLLRSANRCS
ncbi:hypothetical protein SLEP1_g20220 [Rubroshorea leprosula]|uniref:Uncharacterized protein n=1 Tax=Rubroshorea leprosula TaxID=152421 RepID=A0AAV5JAS6_9ROSI|nr:hypothetical protein SLEP1_g20220 [Rubroshorea leprosula]